MFPIHADDKSTEIHASRKAMRVGEHLTDQGILRHEYTFPLKTGNV
jgi:hypothetical protein